MLISVDSFDKLDIPALMEVYFEGNVENGELFWPEESPERRLELAVIEFRRYLAEEFYASAHGTYWILGEAGHYLSALRLEEHPSGLLLEALETRPGFRNRGYAKQLISGVLEQMQPGIRIYSHVDKENEASLAAHLSCGFTRALEYAVSSDGEICDHEVTMEVIVQRSVL